LNFKKALAIKPDYKPAARLLDKIYFSPVIKSTPANKK
jgi:hypothetical protein